MAVTEQIELDDTIDPWDRQPAEKKPRAGSSRPDRYNDLFQPYLLRGRRRSVSDLARELDKSPAYLKKIAWAYRWAERARAWDSAEELRRAAEKEEARTVADKRRGNLGKAFALKAAQWLNRQDHASQRLACRLAETAIRLDVSVYGTPDKHATAALLAPDGAPVDALLAAVPASEEVRAAELAAVLARIAGNPDALAELDPADFDLGDET